MKIFTSIVLGVVAYLLALAAAPSWAFAQVTIPAGTVISITGSDCPTGFTAYAAGVGRVVVGVGTLGSDSYALGATGGLASVVLTEAQMPAHSHGMTIKGSGTSTSQTVAPGPMQSSYSILQTPSVKTSVVGGGDPHENRQPYIALTQCVLDADFSGGNDVTGELFVWAIVVLAFAGGVIAGQQR